MAAERPGMRDSSERRFVIVSGAPAAGKTTLARALAPLLGLGLIAKDDIKEALFDALGGPPGDLAWSRKVGGAAMETLWRLAEQSAGCVLEANFRPHSDYERGRLARLDAEFVEVNCWCPPDLLMRRFHERAKTAHPAHVLADLTPEMVAEFDVPIGLGKVLQIDTSCEVDVPAVAATVARMLAEPPSPSTHHL